MKRAIKYDLSTRWTKEKITVVDSALSSLVPNCSQMTAAFGSIERDGCELVDLRCFPFTKNYSNRTVSHIDFECCVWRPTTGISPVQATHCNFSLCTLDGALNTRFEWCCFDTAKLIETISVPETSFINCDFREASFRSCRFFQCSFEGCSFVSAKMRNTEFEECIFDQCDFSACSFKGCSFGGSRFLRSKNNFRYNQYLDDSIELTEKIFNPKFEIVDFKDTLMGKVKFD